MGRVIGGGFGDTQYAPFAAGQRQPMRDLIFERVALDQMRTGRGKQEAAWGNQGGGLVEQFAIPFEPGGQVLAGFDEGRRIAHDDIEPLVRLAKVFHEPWQGVRLETANLAYPIACRGFSGEFKRWFRAIDTHDVARARFGGELFDLVVNA